MSESRHRNQAQNIVEYAWRHRNHNDDIPRQYLTDILVGSIAEALRIAYTTSYAKEYEDEKARRVYYQDIVYDVCNSLDMAAGRSVTKGQGIVCGTKDEPHDSVQKEVKSVVAELSTLRAQVAWLEERVRLLNGFIDNVFQLWSFDNDQMHTHTWHTREDLRAEYAKLAASAVKEPA